MSVLLIIHLSPGYSHRTYIQTLPSPPPHTLFINMDFFFFSLFDRPRTVNYQHDHLVGSHPSGVALMKKTRRGKLVSSSASTTIRSLIWSIIRRRSTTTAAAAAFAKWLWWQSVWLTTTKRRFGSSRHAWYDSVTEQIQQIVSSKHRTYTIKIYKPLLRKKKKK